MGNQLSKIFETIQKKEKNVILLLILISIIIRIIYSVYFNESLIDKIISDEKRYLDAGIAFSKGNFNPGMFIDDGNKIFLENLVFGPVIPLVIAFFIILFGNPIIPFFIYNLILSSFLIPVMYYLGKYMFGNIYAWFWAVYATLFYESIRFVPHLYKEITIFLLFPLMILFLYMGYKSENPLKYLILSLLSFSLLIHTDERFIIYIYVFIIAIFLYNKINVRKKLIYSVISLIFLIITMLPWSIYLYTIHNQVVILTPRTTVFTSKFYGSDLMPYLSNHINLDNIGNKEKFARDGSGKNIAKELGIQLREFTPSEARIKSFIHFWQPMFIKGEITEWGFRGLKFPMHKNITSMIFYGIFLPFYFISIIMLIYKKQFFSILIASIPIVHSILHAYMVWTKDRYRAQVTIFIVIFAIWAIIEIFMYYSRKFKKNIN